MKLSKTPTNNAKMNDNSAAAPHYQLSAQQLLLLLLCQCFNLIGLLPELLWWFITLTGITIALRAMALFIYYQPQSRLTLMATWVNNQFTQSIVARSFMSQSYFIPALQRFFNTTNKQYQPSKFLLFLFSCAGIILLALSAKTLGVLSTMVHLLALAYVLKVFELKNKNSVLLLSLLGFIVLATNLLFSQSLFFSLYIIIALAFNIASITSIYVFSAASTTHVKNALKLVAQSLPFAILLFFFLPKISPFWTMPTFKPAQSGLSDELNVGDVANLALSNQLAFRVSFKGNIPTQEQLYWRGIILDDFDGTIWKRRAPQYFNKDDVKERLIQIGQQPFGTYESFNYHIIHKANQRHWLYALDIAFANNRFNSQQQNMIEHLTDNTLYRSERINKTIDYQVQSYVLAKDKSPISITEAVGDHAQGISENSNSLAPPQIIDPRFYQVNPQLQAYAKRHKQKYLREGLSTRQLTKALMEQILKDFNQQPFKYTLQPPTLNGHRFDQFFFETRAGFCGHYASTFAFIMRAAGIQTRVVTGYHGGEYNPQGDYFSVYQRDAHAWAEVWLLDENEKSGRWHRVDPTAAVHPLRIEQGLQGELRQQQQELSQDYLSLAHYPHIQWINSLRMQFEALDYQWSKWVLNYSLKNQESFLTQWFGKNAATKVGLFIVVSFLLTMLLISWQQRTRKKATKPPAHIGLYQQAISLFNDHGIVKPQDMTALAFLQTIHAQENINVVSKNSFHILSHCYLQLTYQLPELKPEETLTVASHTTAQHRRTVTKMKKHLALIKRHLST